MTVRHFINLPDIGADTLKKILKSAHMMKAAKMSPPQLFTGLSLAMLFDKPSTRTRLSFSQAMKQLGGSCEILNKNDIQLGGSESIADTARVFSRMVDAVMIRMSSHEAVEEFARYSSIPVINALTDASHPCQIMADLMTIEEKKGGVEGMKITWLGDYNNVARTFMQAAPLFGFELTVSLPPGLKGNAPAGVNVVIDPREAVKGADVVVTDTWVSMGQEGKSIDMFQPYQVNAKLMAEAGKDAIFMHCLPAHRGEEVTDEVMDGPQSVVFDEAENRLHAQKAVLAWCLENAGVNVKPVKR